MKTIIRVSVTLPDCTGRVQRLHDNGSFFKLEEEWLYGEKLADLVCRLLEQGGHKIEQHEFIDDDDFKTKLFTRFEYISE